MAQRERGCSHFIIICRSVTPSASSLFSKDDGIGDVDGDEGVGSMTVMVMTVMTVMVLVTTVIALMV
jgi:hypothetical protein